MRTKIGIGVDLCLATIIVHNCITVFQDEQLCKCDVFLLCLVLVFNQFFFTFCDVNPKNLNGFETFEALVKLLTDLYIWSNYMMLNNVHTKCHTTTFAEWQHWGVAANFFLQGKVVILLNRLFQLQLKTASNSIYSKDLVKHRQGICNVIYTVCSYTNIHLSSLLHTVYIACKRHLWKW